MFLGLVFVWLGPGGVGGVVFLFFFAQALCEVKEILTQTWCFPTCSPLPLPLLHPWCVLFSLLPSPGWGFSGLGCSGWEEGDGSFSIHKCQVFLPVNSKALHSLIALKGKKKKKEEKISEIKQKYNLISAGGGEGHTCSLTTALAAKQAPALSRRADNREAAPTLFMCTTPRAASDSKRCCCFSSPPPLPLPLHQEVPAHHQELAQRRGIPQL